MKSILHSVAAIALVAGTMYAGTAQAAGSCERNLKEVKAAWQNHKDRGSHPGQNESPTKETIQSVIDHAEKDCVAGKNEEANENINLARRHMGLPEVKTGK
ncbi:MAG: hypothetical protein H7840_03675 [Alphaproteobacteria bacterium]